MLYFHQNQMNRIVLGNERNIEKDELFEVEFHNEQFGAKSIEVIAQESNKRFLSTQFELVSDRVSEDLALNRVWLPTGFSTVSIEGGFIDKVFVEFKPRLEFELEVGTKNFVLE